MSIIPWNDLSAQVNMRLMRGRLKDYDYSENIKKSLDGVQNMSQRLLKDGGIKQQDRMIRDKYRSFREALKYSYQGAYVRKLGPQLTMNGEDADRPVRALINSNKLKMDYDDKILSIDFAHGFQCGDIFEWVNTGTYWIVCLQDLTELAYFRGDIRKCEYQIEWLDDGEKKSTYAAIRGPVETKINYIQKHQISVDTPNYSLNIYMPKNKDTLKQFKRYSKFYLQEDPNEDKVCWRVEAVDAFSTEGILEVVAVEYYANETEDDMDAGLVGANITKAENPNSDLIENTINGETFIKPKITYSYRFRGRKVGEWSVSRPDIVELIADGRDAKIKWTNNYSGQFDLICGDTTKTIVVESLF